MKRIEVPSSDVKVVGAASGQPRQSRFGLRLRIAVVIAFAEVLLLAFGSVPVLAVVVIATAFVAFHVFAGRRLPPFLRAISWTAAMSQAMVALFIVALGISMFVVIIVCVLALLIGVMMLLGERK